MSLLALLYYSLLAQRVKVMVTDAQAAGGADPGGNGFCQNG